MEHGRERRRLGRVGLLLLVVGVMGWVSGCATYVNYPAVGDDWAVNDTNVSPAPDLMGVALARVIGRSGGAVGVGGGDGGGGGSYVVNPPRGTELRVARGLVDDLNDRAWLSGARLVSDGTAGLPAFHVTRVLVRGDEGLVDVLRPVGVPGPGGEEVHEPVTVWLRGGGLGGWRVVSTRVWPIGLEGAPERWGWSRGLEDEGGE